MNFHESRYFGTYGTIRHLSLYAQWLSFFYRAHSSGSRGDIGTLSGALYEPVAVAAESGRLLFDEILPVVGKTRSIRVYNNLQIPLRLFLCQNL